MASKELWLYLCHTERAITDKKHSVEKKPKNDLSSYKIHCIMEVVNYGIMVLSNPHLFIYLFISTI